MPTCLNCNESLFVVNCQRFELKVKKQDLQVIVPCHICQKCNTSLLDNEQMNVLRKAAADRYREMNQLLTSKEIVAFREKLGLSQIGFARFLSIGEASIKRWETYYIQDDSQDDHIRLKCDPIYSEANSFYLQSKYGVTDIFSGLRAFSAPLIKHMIHFFQTLGPDYIPFLGKLHFYSDFLHFKKHNRCITGMRYTPLKSGPSPHNYNQLFRFIQSDQYESPKIMHFDDQEKKTLDQICELFVGDNREKICSLSTQEKGFLETKETDFISYGYAKDLLI